MRLLKLILGWFLTKIEDFLRGAQIEYQQRQADRSQEKAQQIRVRVAEAQAEVEQANEKLASLEERAKRLSRDLGSVKGS